MKQKFWLTEDIYGDVRHGDVRHVILAYLIG